MFCSQGNCMNVTFKTKTYPNATFNHRKLHKNLQFAICLFCWFCFPSSFLLNTWKLCNLYTARRKVKHKIRKIKVTLNRRSKEERNNNNNNNNWPKNHSLRSCIGLKWPRQSNKRHNYIIVTVHLLSLPYKCLLLNEILFRKLTFYCIHVAFDSKLN